MGPQSAQPTPQPAINIGVRQASVRRRWSEQKLKSCLITCRACLVSFACEIPRIKAHLRRHDTDRPVGLVPACGLTGLVERGLIRQIASINVTGRQWLEDPVGNLGTESTYSSALAKRVTARALQSSKRRPGRPSDDVSARGLASTSSGCCTCEEIA